MKLAAAQRAHHSLALSSMEEDLAAEDTTIDGLETSVGSFFAVAQEFAQSQAAKRCLAFAYSGMKEVHAGDLKRMRLCSALQFCVTFIERGGTVHTSEGGRTERSGSHEEPPDEETGPAGGDNAAVKGGVDADGGNARAEGASVRGVTATPSNARSNAADARAKEPAVANLGEQLASVSSGASV